MSVARRMRGNMLTAHKAAGTYVPTRLVRHAIADVICQHARISRDRKSLFFESSPALETKISALEAKRKMSAPVRHIAAAVKRSRAVIGLSGHKENPPLVDANRAPIGSPEERLQLVRDASTRTPTT